MQEIYQQLATLITDFCTEKANDEYRVLSLKLCEKLCRKRPSPLLRGKPETWACAIVYAIGTINFIFDRTQTVHLTSQELAGAFGVSVATASAKSKQIRDMFHLHHFDHEWTLPSMLESIPMLWLISIDGLPVDVRQLPVSMQITAYEKGLIPYVPALKNKDADVQEGNV
jgi:hypothetical protein